MTRTKTAPFVRQGVSSMAISMDVLLAGLVLLAMSYLYYGWRPVLLGLIGGVSSLGAQILVSLLLSRRLPTRPVSAAAYGLTVALLLPPSAPYWMPVAGGVFATAVACVPLGGEGHSPFHPAAAGASFLTICFAGQMFAYPAPRAPMTNFLPLGDTASVIAGTSPASVMKNGVSPLTTLTEAVTGQAAGAIGATFILIIAACAVYLIARRAVYLSSILSFLAGIYLIGYLWPRLSTGPITSGLWELLSGSVVFAAVFLVGDRRYASKHFWVRIVLGLLTAAVCMAMRYYGVYEQGAFFAVLLVNAIVPLFDRRLTHLYEKGGALHAEE